MIAITHRVARQLHREREYRRLCGLIRPESSAALPLSASSALRDHRLGNTYRQGNAFSTSVRNRGDHQMEDLQQNPLLQNKFAASHTGNELSRIIVQRLAETVKFNAWENIHITDDGERAFSLEALPIVDAEVYSANNENTAEWLREVLFAPESPGHVTFYVGFEAFYDENFIGLASAIVQQGIPLIFSPLVKSTKEYLRQRTLYKSMECSEAMVMDDNERTIIHLGASHAMDRLLFPESEGVDLQTAWKHGRLVIFSPELAVVDTIAYRASLARVLELLVATTMADKHPVEAISLDRHPVLNKPDYKLLDHDIAETRLRIDEAGTMEEVFTELYSLVSKYVVDEKLDSRCHFDTGWEAMRLFREVSKGLAAKEEAQCLPWSRVDLVMARNAAIGDALHSFYAASPDTFPIVVTGDTAALLAGGVSMININAHNRFGVVIIANNRGMAIEDVISKRSVDGHQFQYEYVKLDKKKDIFTLSQLKDAVKKDVLSSLRDHLWGVSSHRAEAIVLNMDVQSLRKEAVHKQSPTDAVLTGGSFLDEEFGVRFEELEKPRKKLEAIVNVLHQERETQNPGLNLPVKIQGCSAIEFMEIVSQLSMTMRDKLLFLPTPTDLLATRTLLPGLMEEDRTVGRRLNQSERPVLDHSHFVNSNDTFSVFVSNAAFGVDGLNNLISTHLEYGTGTLVHLAYDAAKVVTDYSLIGQVHRPFGVRPAGILHSLYRNHQAYEGQIEVIETCDTVGVEEVTKSLQARLRDPKVKVILLDMGAPDLTSSLK